MGFHVPRLASGRQRIAAGLVLLLAAITAILLTTRIDAADGDAQSPEIRGGTLLLKGKGVTQAIPAVRLGTDMDVTVSGQIARVRVTQAFRNTSDQWMEATYLYPLPESGAVDTLKMVVGQRVIIGRIKRRAEAREIYEKAKAEGKKAGLVEQERPNMFRNSVANVGPGETVLVQIEYQAPVRQQSGDFSLRLPLVVGPRYVPPHTLVKDGAKDEGTAPDPKAIADAEAVTAPLVAPQLAATEEGKTLNPVSITVRLAPGFAPANLISRTHKIAIADDGPERRTIRLATGEAPADRDFELSWRSATADPTVGLWRQQQDGKDYVMAAITPPTPEKIGAPAPREMIFVIDNSGSMAGDSMDEAKKSLLHALDTLTPRDRFNVIRFDDTMTQLFEAPVAATAEQVGVARRFTEGLKADGGTEMLPALKAALVDADAGSPMLRQLIFLTDGSISNEREMLEALAANAGRSRVFMVGIGSAPNSFLMTRMAEVGRGSYTHISTAADVDARMTALLDRLRLPAVRDLKVSVSGVQMDVTPRSLPDLYAGEPLVLLGRTDSLAGTLTVSGRIGDTPWTRTVNLGEALESPSVARLWAKRRIDDVEVARWTRQIEDAQADEAIAQTGLAFSLVTSQTSLIAVDETPSRPAGAQLTKEELPLLLPAGWDFDVLFGGAAAKAAQANAEAQAKAAADNPPEAAELPKTATNYLAMVEQGALLIAIGLIGLWATRRRTAKAAA